LAHLISKFLGIPKAALLCAPAFYKDDRSTKLRLRSYSLIYSLVYPENLPQRVGKLLNLIAERVKIAITKPLLSMILKDFDLVIAVSASIGQEMNGEWQGRIRVLNPNTSYEHMRIAAQSREDHRENYKYDAIFFSRLSPEKGILDIPLVWKELVAKGLVTKLAIAGKFEEEEVEKAFFELVDRLSLNEYIEYLGWLPHKKLGVLLQNSKMLIYPSYQDSISFVVMESLAHNKIVVAYDTLAIRCNYPIREVVKVKTGDYRAMAQKINDILVNEEYRNVNLKEYLERFKSWDEVVRSEVKILENARLLKTV
jgi:glycosyltransferase involved in cell wall biosynthesis